MPLNRAAQPRFAAPESYTPKHLAERILTSKSALEGERKQVTVLFADLKGSMELLADRDPEEARKILDPVLERMTEAVHRYEGTVNQVMGDGIMALFGAPIAHEDHAVRACYAALRMQESIGGYGDEVQRTHGVPIQIRIGLNSGDVVVRAIGSDLRMDYTAVGQTTHLAARMEQVAKAGSTLMTADTLRLVEGYVEVKLLGPVSVKGLAEPVDVYELAGAGQARTRLQAAAIRGLTRFVGRDAEVEHLRRVLARAAAGHGQVVTVVGEAGVGKSRLVYEFTHSHRIRDWLVLEAASVSYGKATSYLPVIDLLKGYFKIGDRDDHREMRDKVLGRVLGLDRALEPLLPPLLSLLDVSVEDPAWQALDPPQRRQRTLDAIKRLLLRESQAQPLLVVFEDLHWIDGETQAFLDSLVESLASARLLLLVNYRPEYEHHWGSRTAYSQLRLDALPAESTTELLGALLGQAPELEPVKRMLVKRGNPFFLEETVRTLVETGALAGERGAYRLTRPVEALQVPTTVQTVLAARIDRLPPEGKQLLQAASVIGKDVPYAILAAIAEQPEETLRRGLRHLQEAEFLYEARLFPDLEYTFKHALTHEVAYAGLLQDRRRSLHGATVKAIEQLYPDRLVEHAEQLGYHALRGEVWELAVRYLRQAGLKAISRSANREAVRYLEQALAALAHLPVDHTSATAAVDLRLDLRTALFPLGEFPKILTHLREAEAITSSIRDTHRRAQISSYVSQSLFLRGDYDGALEAGNRALKDVDTSTENIVQVSTHFILGQVYSNRGAYRSAIEYFAKNIERLQGSRLHERFALPFVPAVLSRAWAGRCYAELGDFHEALPLGEEALQMAQGVSHPFTLADASREVASIHIRHGDWHKAIPLLESSLDLCRTFELLLLFPGIATGLGYAYVGAGQIDRGLHFLEQGIKAADSLGINVAESSRLRVLAEGYALVGRRKESSALATRALAVARQRQERAGEASILEFHGQLAADDPSAPDQAQAEHYYRLGRDLAAELGMRPLVAHCHLGLGKLYGRTGDRRQAQEHLTTATTMYREMGMHFWLEQAEAEMRALAEQG